MLRQTIIWTALPNGIGSTSTEEGTRTLCLSVFVTPRLWEDSSVTQAVLSAFPDFLNWPAVVCEAAWKVEFGNGLKLGAKPQNVDLRPQLWEALFKKTTTVVPFVFEDLTGAELQTFSAVTIHDVIKEVYQRVACGEGRELPDRTKLAADPDLEAIARPIEYPPNEKGHAFDTLTAYLEPYDDAESPTKDELPDRYDFHDMIAALGDYPTLLRYLGLVVDLAVRLPQGTALPAKSTVQIVPALPSMEIEPQLVCPRTHYTLSDGGFLASPRSPTLPGQPAEMSNGLLRLDAPQLFRVMQLDVAGSGVKLQNTATNLVALKGQDLAIPDEAGLPALRTAGISIVRPDENAAKLKESLEQSYNLNHWLMETLGEDPPDPVDPQFTPQPTDELFAEDLVRGYRIDVLDERTETWHSLCQRVGTYTFRDTVGGPEVFEKEDEGFAQPGATEPLPDAPPDKRELRVHESLFTWDGWSLCAPRPGKTMTTEWNEEEGEEEKNMIDPSNEAATQFGLEVNFRAKPGSLPRLRYGRTYRLRARVVDLAGNSVFGADDDRFGETPTEAGQGFTFRRFEPIDPPPLMLRTEPKEGESLERLVVRSGFAPYDIPQSTERHVAPPKVSQVMAERHGQFDGSWGNPDGYELACREAGSLTEKLDPNTCKLEPIEGAKEVKTPEHTYWLQENESLEVTYLPDPYARGVLLRGLPGEIEVLGQEKITQIPFMGEWPDLAPFRLRLEGIEAGAAPGPPQWDGEVLTVQLAQGDTTDVRINCYLDPGAGDLDNLAIWQWIVEACENDPATLDQLKEWAAAGMNWLCMPYRTLTLVHAVQQPLRIPCITELDIDPKKELGETSVTLQGKIVVSAKSTGKVDLRAAWRDPIDDGDGPRWVEQDMHVAEIPVTDPDKDEVTVLPIRHALGDTKYHAVTYTVIGTTRFREYFPRIDQKFLICPVPGETDESVLTICRRSLDILNSARPDAPKPLYVLPTFEWDPPQEENKVVTKVRRGGGLRVYMERPWCSSGAGELLGVLVRSESSESIAEGSALAKTLKKYTSEWGMDPIWPAEPTPFLTLGSFEGAETKEGLSLEELTGVSVDVAGYKPAFDKYRKLWYCDIKMAPGDTYFPFVRLALVRYQPKSVDDAHLSRVVLSDFVQVAPDRTVKYDLNNVLSMTMDSWVDVTVSGPCYFSPEPAPTTPTTTVMVARLEQRQYAGMADEEALGWEAVSTEILEPVEQSTRKATFWKGRVTLPQQRPQPLRVVIMEAELLPADGPTKERPRVDFIELLESGSADALGAGLFERRGSRIVFADALVIP